MIRHTNIIKVSSSFTKSLQASFRPMIASSVKTNLPSVIKANDIDILEIDEKLDIISASLREKIKVGFEEYGLTVPQLYVTSVVLPENDPNFKLIRELHTIVLQTRVIRAEATVKTAEAQSKAQYRMAEEQAAAAIEAARREAEMQRQMTQTEVARREAERKVIGAQAEAQAQRMQGLTEAEIMAAKGYNQKDVLQAEVQEAYAAGIGNMGSGASGMFETIMVTVLVSAMCGLIREYGGFEALLGWIRKAFRGKRGGQIGMGLLVGAMDIATANNTVAIVMANPIAKEMSKDYGISSRKAAARVPAFAAMGRFNNAHAHAGRSHF